MSGSHVSHFRRPRASAAGAAPTGATVPSAAPSALRPPPTRAATLRSLAPVAILAALTVVVAACSGDVEGRMAEVRALQDVGQFTESIDELREILAVSPDLAEANYRLGVALVQTGEPSRAVWALQKASESPDYAIVAGLLLASAHFQNQNFEEAIRASNRVLEQDPDRIGALRLRANANLGATRLEDALADSQRLVELQPDDYPVQVLHATVLMDLGRTEEARVAHDRIREMGAASEDPEIQHRSCLAPAVFAMDHLNDVVKAEAAYEECAALYPTEPFVLNHMVEFFDEIEKPDRGTELIRAAVEKAPESLPLRTTLANRLASRGQVEDAEAVLVDAVESFGSAVAWNQLANFHRRTGNPEKALEAIAQVEELTGAGNDRLRFMQADVLVDLGRLDEAEAVAETLEEPTYAKLVRGRILLLRGDAAGALESFEQGIRHWPNNAGARYLAGLAARELGDYDRAVSELREAVRADRPGTDAAFVLARLHYDRGEYTAAMGFATASLAHRTGGQRRAEAYQLATRIFTKLEQFERARGTCDELAKMPDQAVTAAVERATVEQAAEGTEAAVAWIEGQELPLDAPENESLLRLWTEYSLELGRGDAVLKRLARTVAKNPDAASIQELQATALARAGRIPESRAAYEKALALDSENAASLAGLATLEGTAGNFAKSIELFDKAAELAPDRFDYAYSAAQLSLAAGLPDESEQRLRDLIRRAPGHAGARNDLAWRLADRGEDLDLALELANQARKIDPAPEILDTLGWVHLKRGEVEEAVAVFEEAVAAAPDSPSIRYRLGTALIQAGDSGRAGEMLRTAVEAGTFPEAEAARRELARLERP